MKAGVAAAAHWSHLDRWVGSRRGVGREPLVLGYHRVVEDFERSSRNALPSMLVSRKTLRQHLEWVGERYRFVSIDELAKLHATPHGEPSSTGDDRPLAAVTFDDGYQDVYENAFPLLESMGIPFAVYVVTDLVGTDRLLFHDELFLRLSAIFALDADSRADHWDRVTARIEGDSNRIRPLVAAAYASEEPYRALRLLLHGLRAEETREVLRALRAVSELDEPQREEHQSMDWNMLREMRSAGATIGSHTRTHALLATQPEPVVREELEGSRLALEKRLGEPVRHLAYPDGSFEEDTVRIAHEAGYATACTTCGHGSETFPALAISRHFLWEGTCMDGLGGFSPAMLSCHLNGVFDRQERCNNEH